MRTASMMVMDTGDGMIIYVTLLTGEKVERGGITFTPNTDGLTRAGNLMLNWCAEGKGAL